MHILAKLSIGFSRYALRMAKTLVSFGHSKCSRVKILIGLEDKQAVRSLEKLFRNMKIDKNDWFFILGIFRWFICCLL